MAAAVARLAANLGRHAPDWAGRQIAALTEQCERGVITPYRWRARGSRAHGVLFLEEIGPEYRLVAPVLVPGNAASLGELLADLEGRRGQRPLSVTDRIPGLSPGEERSFFEVRRYWHRRKVRMRRPAGRAPRTSTPDPRIRPVVPSDRSGIERLHRRAYAERPGEFWTWAASEPEAEASARIGRYLDGAGGWAPYFLPEASFVSEGPEGVEGAVLVERRDDLPYVAQLIVEPTLHRNGIGRRLLERALAWADGQGAPAVTLAAILDGAPYRLYRRLGFERVLPPAGDLDGHWVHGEDPFGPEGAGRRLK